uniref:Uncharacterized protein n=1 Tax=Anguilla anguilla TaxID=7936 RepID=A0A0E9XIG4_ANGAN
MDPFRGTPFHTVSFKTNVPALPPSPSRCITFPMGSAG